MLPELIKRKIEKKYGKRIAYTKDCVGLAHSINTATNERISALTLMRLFGVISHKVVKPRLFTLDTLAKYLEYKSWDDLFHEYENEEFKYAHNVEMIINKQLRKGDVIMLHCYPDWLLSLEYDNENCFKIKDIKKEK